MLANGSRNRKFEKSLLFEERVILNNIEHILEEIMLLKKG